MKTQITRYRVGTIEEFADEYGLTMKVVETGAPADSDERYEARFSNGMPWTLRLIGMTLPDLLRGKGNTPEAAVEHYARMISCEEIVRESDSKRIQVWRLDEKPAEPAKEPTTQPEIAPCPVCGSEAKIDGLVGGYRVTCRKMIGRSQ